MGGRATGGLTNLRLRILEDQDESRIIYIQKLAAGGIIPGTSFKLTVDEKTRRIKTGAGFFILRKEAYQRLLDMEKKKQALRQRLVRIGRMIRAENGRKRVRKATRNWGRRATRSRKIGRKRELD